MIDETDGLSYDGFGIAIGLISYPFYTDGKNLFQDVFVKNLFEPHLENLSKFSLSEPDENLYQPRGYRLMGRQGLAVISLIDDYAFSNRIFNANHTHGDRSKPDHDHEDYTWKIITGVSEQEPGTGEDYLLKKAKETFLRKEGEQPRYPFIGIMKMKIDHRLISGKGILLTRLIKKAIAKMVPDKNYLGFDYFVIDCFDTDELAVVAFSNDLYFLHRVLYHIKGMKNDNIVNLAPDGQQERFLYLSEGKVSEKHIFSSCHINLGYDISFRFDRQKENENFMGVRERSPRNVDLSRLHINFECEPKPGHGKDFVKLFKTDTEEKFIIASRQTQHPVKIEPYITGGASKHLVLPFEAIHEIEALCVRKDFRKHVRKVKVSLSYPVEYTFDTELDESHETGYTPDRFKKEYVEQIKKLLNGCGVSKVIRERVLSLYRLYNESLGDLLHSIYLEELHDGLLQIRTILEEFCKDEKVPIKEIDRVLCQLIEAFEEAFYNRFHQKSLSNANLEYNGSVQQYLTAFNFVYKEILKVLWQPEEVPKHKGVFASITGYERVSSTRLNLKLNINQITYPELFASTVWKEGANFANPVREHYFVLRSSDEQAEVSQRLDLWRKYIEADSSFNKIKFSLDSSGCAAYMDDAYGMVHEILNRQLLDYFIIDQIVYHFGFQRDFKLYWHFYWKILLQTGNCYFRNECVDRKHFIYMLLRMMMLGLHNHSAPGKEPGEMSDNLDFINEQADKPYDSLLANLWFTDYHKVLKCARSIYESLNKQMYREVCEDIISQAEQQLATKTPYLYDVIRGVRKTDIKNKRETESYRLNSYLLCVREPVIENIRQAFARSCLITPAIYRRDTAFEPGDGITPDYAICMLNAFLRRVMEIDLMDRENAVIRCVPRGSDGEVSPLLNVNENKDARELLRNTINLPADSFGGLFIPDFRIRKEYFSVRTAFYKSIWHYKQLAGSSNKKELNATEK